LYFFSNFLTSTDSSKKFHTLVDPSAIVICAVIVGWDSSISTLGAALEEEAPAAAALEVITVGLRVINL
jgi:hypothetical protein